MKDQKISEDKIEFYFLRKSAESFSSDLNQFTKNAKNFSNEQLLSITSFFDQIRDNVIEIKKELEKRLDIK